MHNQKESTPTNHIQETTKIQEFNSGIDGIDAVEKQVLVVDDSPDIRMIAKIVLESGGYNVSTAESGSEAYEFLTNKSKPDLILLDISMEGMSGVEFLDMLAEKRPDLIRDIPVVFFTGYDDVTKGLSVGQVTKPIKDIGKFLIDIRQFISNGPRRFPYAQ